MTDHDPTLLDIKLLRLLDQLYTTHSVTRSAQALGQSQPTVSIWLAKLRQQLGDPLFVRTAQGMLPTPRTEALMVTVREVLDGIKRLSQASATFDPATAQRRFSIAMTDASHITLLPRLLAHVRALAPGVSLEASRIDDGLAVALQTGKADLALGFLPGLDAGFYQQALYAQDWVCLANAQHPRVIDAKSPHWGLDAYQAESHISIIRHGLPVAGQRGRGPAIHASHSSGITGVFGPVRHPLHQRPHRHPAPPHRRDSGTRSRLGCAAMPFRDSRLHRQTILAYALPPGR